MAAHSHKAVTSAITFVECSRVLDRWRITKEIGDEKLVAARLLCSQILSGLRVISIDEQIISLASQTFPIALKSLDAVHLASALQLKKQTGHKILMLTHDTKLHMAAVAMSLEVLPIP